MNEFKMNHLIIFLFFVFLISPKVSFADFKPLKLQIEKFQNVLAESDTISKRDVKKNLKFLMNKAKLVENKLAKGHINDDLKFLMDKFVYKNSKNSVKSSELTYWIKHLHDELKMFKKDMGIDG